MESKPLRCALISKDDDFRQLVSDVLGDPTCPVELAGHFRGNAAEMSEALVGKLLDVGARIAIVDLGDDVQGGIPAVRGLSERGAAQQIVVTGPALDADVLLEILRAGASEYLPGPVTLQDVAGALDRVLRKSGATAPETRPPGLAYAVYSAKGGTGVTTVAVNLAVRLADVTGKKTLLLDLNRDLGTAALALGVRPRYTFVDLVRNAHRLDPELLDSYIEKHESGVGVLGSPVRVEDSAGMTPSDAQSLLRFLQREFDYVVVDLGKASTALEAAVLERTEANFLVTTPELPTLRNVKRFLTHYAGSAAVARERTHVLLNCFQPDAEIQTVQVEQALGMKVHATLSRDDDAVIHSLNAGRPLVQNGKSRFSKDLKALADRLAGPAHRNGKTAGGLKRIISALPFGSAPSNANGKRRARSHA